MTKRNVVAVVLNWRDTDNTLECIDSLVLDGSFSCIIVVDNESAGHLRAPLEDRAPGVITLIERKDNLGFSAGVNVGLRRAVEMEPDFILVINNDAVLSPGCVSSLLKQAKTGVGIYAPMIHNVDSTLQSAGDHVNRLSARISAPAVDQVTNFLTWACVLIPVETIKVVGYLDELFFMYWEDVDYAFRCSMAGLRLVVVPEAHVVHKLGASNASAGWRIQLFWMLGLARLTKKWGGTFWLGLAWRLIRRTLKLVCAGDLRGLHAAWRGLLIGLRSKEPAAHVLKGLGVI